jgi:hypothetical protein
MQSTLHLLHHRLLERGPLRDSLFGVLICLQTNLITEAFLK